jgi:peptide deformylase
MMKLVLAPDVMLETPVTAFDYNLMHPAPVALDMIDIMTSNSGLGLSANQVGFPYQIFVMKPVLNKKFGSPLVVMNPVIKGISQEKELGVEGCLSHPNLYLRVKRPISCIVEFDSLSENFRDIVRVETKFDDIDARIFLHEYDHLHGIQFIDRVSKLKLQLAETRRQKRKKNG